MIDLRTGCLRGTVATDPGRYVNAVEGAPAAHAALGPDGRLRLAVATGRASVGRSRSRGPVANVAFRPGEPVSTWFDKQQALALGKGTIDEFFATIDAAGSAAGLTERVRMLPGYFERVFASTASISHEGGSDGIFQPYGLYVPKPTARPAAAGHVLDALARWQGALGRGGVAAIIRDQGDLHGGFVFAPRGRGTSSWYLGVGMVDFNEVWNDAMSSFAVDPTGCTCRATRWAVGRRGCCRSCTPTASPARSPSRAR